ncbi:hypothetical protein GCM10011321_08950 [Youhaiella tibetensis]|nr:hypothetical protein GCM10011321_08950 [Youhaiella tibetensis]
MARIAGFDLQRDGVADHRPELGHEILDNIAIDDAATIDPADLFPSIVDGRRREAAQAQQITF